MTFQFKKADPLDLAAYQQRTEPGDGFVDSFNKAKRSFELNDTSISEANALEEVWQPIIDEMNSRETGETFYNPSYNFRISIFNEEAQNVTYNKYVDTVLDAIETNDAFSDLRGAVDRQMIFEQAAQLARDSRQEYLKSVQNISTTRGTIGSFSGAAVASLDDPILIASMLFGGAKGLWQMAFQEAALGAGAEALVQTKVQEWYKKTGQEYTDEQFWNAVKFGAAAGFATPFAFRGAGKTIQIGGKVVDLTVDQLKSGIAALRAVGVPRSSEARVLEELADDVQALDDANPLRSEPTFDIAASHEHKTRVEAASVAVERNQAPLIPDEPKVPPRAPESVYGPDNLDGTVFRFDPDELQVDAELFQFKSGGDEFGVTDRLQGITTWDPIKAGQVTVFEFADGRRFIADGHQRMGLARRIKAADPSQDVRLYGHLLRQVDGYTTADARVIAAVKNIAEGTGTALDAAKILKDAPERIGELPPRSRLVQQAQGLVLLSNKAFGAIINNVIPANYGAIIGRLIPEDEGMQDAAIAVLAKTQPANEFQAESIVRQVMDAGAETRTQESLFGEEVITESYFAERAKVLDQAVKQLRKDKASFANLVKNQKRLEAEGNKLAQSANKRRADNDSQAIGLLQALANIKGPLSDGLTAAARTARETGSYGRATDGFLEDVRRSIQEGDFDRFAAGDAGRIVNDTPQSSPRPAEPEPDVALFDEPAGVGVQRQADQLEADINSQIEAERLGDIELDDEPRLYFSETDDAVLMPLEYIIPLRAREAGIMRGQKFMLQAARGEIQKRQPLSVIPREDGTFELADGNSTYAIAQKQGFNSLPVRIMSREQFAEEEARKAAQKIALFDDKAKGRLLRKEDLGTAEFERFDQILRNKQEYKDVDDILKRNEPLNEKLNDDVAEIAVTLNSGKSNIEDMVLYLPGPLKTKASLTKKINEKYAGNLRRVTDVARSTIVLRTPDQVDEVLKSLVKKEYHVIWEGWSKTPAGYVDGKITLKRRDGDELMELQVHHIEMLRAKEAQDVLDNVQPQPIKGALGAHDLYDIYRDIKRTRLERDEALAEMNRIYGAALETASKDEAWSRLFSSLDTSAPKTAAASMKSASEISGLRSAFKTYKGFTESQESAASSQMTAREPSSVAATSIEPSKRTKRMIEPPTETITDIATESNDAMALMRGAALRAIAEDRDAIPIGSTIDEATGLEIAVTQTRQEMLDEIAQDKKMLDRLRDCVT